MELETRSASVKGYHCSERMLFRCTSSGTLMYCASGGSRLKASTAPGNSRKLATMVCAVWGMRWRKSSSVGKPAYIAIAVVCNTDMAVTFTQQLGRTGSLQYRLRYQLSNCTTTCFPAIDLQMVFVLACACCPKGGNKPAAKPACENCRRIPLDALISEPTAFSSGRAIFLNSCIIAYTWRANTPYHLGHGDCP